jgi:hypothetical protein
VRLQAKPTKVNESTTSSSKPEPTPTAGETIADAVKHAPAHEHQDHLVTSTDLEANKTDVASEQTPQAAPAGKYTSAVELLKHTYAIHGFKGWYQGMSAQILKAVLSQGAFGWTIVYTSLNTKLMRFSHRRYTIHAQRPIRGVRPDPDARSQEGLSETLEHRSIQVVSN